MIKDKIELANVVQIMLRQRILPCQCQDSPMWTYWTDDEPTIRQLFCTTWEKLWKALFKAQEKWPAKKEDQGLCADKLPSKV